MTHLTRPPDRPVSPEVGFLAIIALYLMARPLSGFLQHDAMLYAVQALFRLEGWPLGDDLFLRYGNQARYSLFPASYGRLIDSFGLMGANLRLLAFSTALWIVALWLIVRSVFPNMAARVLAFGLVLALAPHYGNGVLSYGEPFLTSRVLAEALGMLALATLTGRRPLLGLGPLSVALLMHPLVGLGAGGIWLAFLLNHPLRFVTVIAFVTLLAGLLAQAGLGPFAWLFEGHGPVWGASLQQYESLGFISSWGYRLFVVPMVPLLVIILSTADADPRVRRLAQATVLATTVAFLLSFVGAELLGNKLLTAMQFWRVSGWMALLGNLLVLRLVMSERFGWYTKGLFLAMLGANVLEHFLSVMPSFSAALAVLAVLHHLADRPGWVLRLLRGLMLICAGIVLFGTFGLIVTKLQVEGGRAFVDLTRAVVIGLVLMAIARWRDVPGAITCGAALGFALWAYDARSPWQRYVDGAVGVPPGLAAELDGKNVYWEDGLPILWFKLKQPQFYSCNQKAGTLFYPRQAQDFDRRAAALRELDTVDFDPQRGRFCPSAEMVGSVTQERLGRVCGALPELNMIVLNDAVRGLPASSWAIPDQTPLREVFLYDCGDIRTRAREGAGS